MGFVAMVRHGAVRRTFTNLYLMLATASQKAFGRVGARSRSTHPGHRPLRRRPRHVRMGLNRSRSMSRNLSASRGAVAGQRQALVEFMIVFPLLALLIFGIIEMGGHSR
jgi:hypothetical protein